MTDPNDHIIRKISADGQVSTFAGSAGQSGSVDGQGAAARFNAPKGITVDRFGVVYVADTGNHTIRKITPDGTVTTLAGQPGKSGYADGAASTALFDSPSRLTVDTNGTVYLYDSGLRKITGGQVTTVPIPDQTIEIYGNNFPVSIHDCPAVDANGTLYFWSLRNRVPSLGNLSVIVTLDSTGRVGVAGTPVDSNITTGKHAIANDPVGNIYATIDYMQSRARVEHFIGQKVTSTSLVGGVRFLKADGSPTAPLGFTVDQAGNWYYTRSSDSAIIRNDSVYAGWSAGIADGTGSQARFEEIKHMDIDRSGNLWVVEEEHRFITDSYYGLPVRKITPSGIVTTEFDRYYYNPIPYQATGLSITNDGIIYLSKIMLGGYNSGSISRLLPSGRTETVSSIGLRYPASKLASDPDANLWAYTSQNHEILRKPINGDWASVAGAPNETNEIKDGTGTTARINDLESLKADAGGNGYFLDYINPGANADGPTPAAYIRKVSPDGTVVTMSQNLHTKVTQNEISYTRYPTSLAIGSDGMFFVTDLSSIKQIDRAGNEVLLGGSTSSLGTNDGLGQQARFSAPDNIVVDDLRNLYVTDSFGTVVRRGEFLGYTPDITTQPQSQTVSAGSSVQFVVTATSDKALSYQWQRNGQPISGATFSSYSFTGARTADAGDYTVVVTNDVGSTTSDIAKLTVTGGSTPTTPAPSGGSGGGGGGGSPSLWFSGALAVLGLARGLRKLQLA